MYLTPTVDARSSLAEPACGATHLESIAYDYSVRWRQEQALHCGEIACRVITPGVLIGLGPNPVNLHAAASGSGSLQFGQLASSHAWWDSNDF